MPNPFRHVLTKSLTATQRDLLENYIPEAEEEEKKERRRWQPLQMLLDLLSRGQYVTANIAEAASRRQRGETGEGTRLGQAAWQGFTGKRKGDWEKVLFGGQVEGGEEFGGWFPEARAKEKPLIRWTDKSGKQRGIIRPTKWAGFAANMLLDPTTYVGLGPTKAARGAAGTTGFAADWSKVLRRMLQNPEEMAKLIKKPVGELTEKGAKRISAQASHSMARKLAEAYRTAKRHALRTPAKELRGEMSEAITKQLARERSAFGKTLSALDPEELVAKTAEFQKGIRPMEALKKNIPQLYEHAGERAIRIGLPGFAGKELGTSARDPNMLVRGIDKFKDWFGASEKTATLRDAWWTVNNSGKLGELRRSFGIWNPYQKMLNLQMRQGEIVGDVTLGQGLVDALQITADEKMLPTVELVMQRAEELGKGVNWEDVLRNPEELAQLGIKDPESIRKVIAPLRDYLDNMYHAELSAVAEESLPTMKYRENYLPGLNKGSMERARASRNIGGASPGFTKKRLYLRKERVEMEEVMARQIFGLKPDEAKRFVNEFNLGEYSTDLREMLMYRTIGHARLMKHVHIVKQFKEFGIPIDELTDLTKTYVGINRALPQLGLTKVSGEAFQGLLFDEDVARIIERVTKATTTELPKLRRMMGGFMSWWRAVVTMSPGFHIRNHISNSITGFTVHGYKWFDLERTADALAGTVYTLNRTNPALALKEMNLSQKWYFEHLNHVRGGKTIRELADEAYERGVITTATKGFDPVEGAEELGRVKRSPNPFRQENIWFQGSHWMGNRIENTPRFKSFLIDVEDMAQEGGEAMKRVMDYSATRSRRWWLDYGDLTDQERIIRDSMIPFYCVPEDAEALTRDGWKRHEDIKVGDEILTYNLDTEKQEWQPVQAMNRFDFNGELEVLKSKYGTFRCTENHKWPVQVQRTFVKKKWYGGNCKLVETKDLNTSHLLKLAAVSEDQESILTPREAAILGWVVTDGYFRWRGNHFESMIYQKKDKMVNIIRGLCSLWLTSESVHPTTGTICFRLSTVWALKVLKYFKSKEDLPGLVTRLSNEAAGWMWEAMMLAEGHTSLHHCFSAFAQKPGPVLEAFQILCQMLGKPFGYAIRKNSSNWGNGPCATGYIRKRTNLKVSYLKKSSEAYRGVVWCPTVENGTWVMRQNGKPIITGNSWIRKNLANQIAGVGLYPEMYSMFPKLQQLATIEDPGFDPSLIPEWMKDLGAFPVQEEDGKFVFFNPNIPIQDINRIPLMFAEGDWRIGQRRPRLAGREALDDIIEMTSPIVKTIMSKITEKGYDAFYKRDLDYYGKAPFVFRLFTKSPKMVGFLDSAVKRMGGNGLGLRVNEQSGKMEMDASIAKLLETNLPILRTLDRLALTGTALIPGLEEALEAATGATDDYEKLDSFFQWLSWYGGIKFKTVDLEEARREYGEDVLKRAEEERKRVRSGQRLPRGAVSSGTKWRDQRQKYKERLGLP